MLRGVLGAGVKRRYGAGPPVAERCRLPGYPSATSEVLPWAEEGRPGGGHRTRRCGDHGVRVLPLRADAGADDPALRLARPARRADAPDAGLCSRHDAPDRLPVLLDADPPVHVP